MKVYVCTAPNRIWLIHGFGTIIGVFKLLRFVLFDLNLSWGQSAARPNLQGILHLIDKCYASLPNSSCWIWVQIRVKVRFGSCQLPRLSQNHASIMGVSSSYSGRLGSNQSTIWARCPRLPSSRNADQPWYCLSQPVSRVPLSKRNHIQRHLSSSSFVYFLIDQNI